MVTDQNGCTAVYIDTIYSPDQLTIFLSIADATCNDSGDGMLEAQASGGTSPFEYAWSNNQTTFQISGLDTGVYSVTITDNNGCEAVANETVGFINPDPINPLDSSYVLCTDEIVLDAGNPGSTFNWSSGEATQTINVNTLGFYTVSVTDLNGCSSDATTEVSDCVGVEETVLVGSIQLFPNPTRGNVMMSFDVLGVQHVNFTLYNIEGRPLISDLVNLNNGKANEELNLTSFSAGVYFITFESEGKTQTQRITLQ